MKFCFWSVLIFVFLMAFPIRGLAQDADSLDVGKSRKEQKANEKARFSTDGDNYVLVEESDAFSDTTEIIPPKKNPKLAGWLSFAVPGLGQIYNKMYWKVPIIYAGAGVIYYFFDSYQIKYKQLKNDEHYFLEQRALASQNVSGKPIANVQYTRSFYNFTNENDIVYYMNKYRHYRDLCIGVMCLLYVANIFDAVVDAHLYDFDVSDDIAIRLEPFATQDIMCNNAPRFGAKLTLRF